MRNEKLEMRNGGGGFAANIYGVMFEGGSQVTSHLRLPVSKVQQVQAVASPRSMKRSQLFWYSLSHLRRFSPLKMTKRGDARR